MIYITIDSYLNNSNLYNIYIKFKKKMALDYEKIQKWSRILTIFASLVLIVLGIARFCNIMNVMNPIDYIVNVYMM